MNSEQKYQISRVSAALRYAQKRLGKSFVFLIEPAEKPMGASRVLQIDRTERGLDDRNHFRIWFDTEEVAATSAKDLRVLAGHEVLHALTFRMGELARKNKKHRAEADNEEENVVYSLQRALFGEVSK